MVAEKSVLNVTALYFYFQAELITFWNHVHEVADYPLMGCGKVSD